ERAVSPGIVSATCSASPRLSSAPCRPRTERSGSLEVTLKLDVTGGRTGSAAVVSYSFVSCVLLTAMPMTPPRMVHRMISQNRRRMAEMMKESSTVLGDSSLGGVNLPVESSARCGQKLTQRYVHPLPCVHRDAQWSVTTGITATLNAHAPRL